MFPADVLKSRSLYENPIQDKSKSKEPSGEENFVYKYHKKIDHIKYMKKKVIKAEKLYEFMDVYKNNYLDQNGLQEKSLFFKKPF